MLAYNLGELGEMLTEHRAFVELALEEGVFIYEE